MNDLTRRQLQRLIEADDTVSAALDSEVGLHRRLLAVLGASEALGDHLIAHPGLWRCLRLG
ncbi:MAG: hypothetical protein ACRD0P_34800, partial [Stackebrandtia sp.]